MAQDIVAKIQAAAQASGVDPDVALRVAGVESSFRPAAKNTESTAAGLFQVTDDTWKDYGGDPRKKLDVDENIRVGMKILSSNKASMQKFLGREPLPSDIYAAHFFGPTGGAGGDVGGSFGSCSFCGVEGGYGGEPAVGGQDGQ